MTEAAIAQALKRLTWPVRLTHLGLWAERLSIAFWPVWTVLITALAAAAFGVQDLLPLGWLRAVLVTMALILMAAFVTGARRFATPTRIDALARLDASLPGRPISALMDRQAIGGGDPQSLAVWAVHRERMAARAAKAETVAPDLRLSARDPYSLRYVGLTALVMALMFGSIWRVASVADLGPGAAEAMAGPSWEGWAQPPAYTGKPSLYLNDIAEGPLTVPVGTRVQLRFYGTPGALTVSQSVSGIVEAPAAPAVAATGAPVEAMQGVTDLVVQQSGSLAVEGPGGRVWQIIATPDGAPAVEVKGEVGREADGHFRQDFSARDDHGVTSGQVTITLDLARVERRFGLSMAPEPVEPVVLDLPLPMSGSRTAYDETLIDDLSEHVFANLPVTLKMTVTDAAGQTGAAAPYPIILPGRRFFDPLAAAIIEMRRDILWNRKNAARSAQILKAVTWQSEDFIRNEDASLRLRVALRTLDVQSASLTPETRDALGAELWSIALLVEEGDLANALERLRRAQDRLDEAIRNGASPEEIDELMQEMQQALNDYMRELAEEGQRNPENQQSQQGQTMEFSADQLQQMLDKLQQLMKEGRTAEAAELMEQLRKLMENMQVTQGEGQGQGQGKGNPSMQGLQETLRGQQGLSDDSFRGLQQGQQEQQPGEGEPGQNPPRGKQGEGQQGRDGQGQGDQPGTFAERQRALRERLRDLQAGQMPGDGSENGETGRQELERADRAMREAEDALRDGDLPGAMDRQAEAMEALRDGIRNFGEALAEEQREELGTTSEGDQAGTADPSGRDPLGREQGDSAARLGSDGNMLQESPGQRAQALLDEIRRRSGDQTRPNEELDYLRRLLSLF